MARNSHAGNSTDGAANMKGRYREFSAWLSKEIETQIHVWCVAHDLQLVMPETVFSYHRMIVWDGVSHDALTQKKFTDWGRCSSKKAAFKEIFGLFAQIVFVCGPD